MKSDNSKEIFPVVDEEGRVVGSATRGECHGGSMLLHPVVHLHIFDARGRIYLQKRPEWKDIQPGKWDTAVGGHVDFGEDVSTALRREAREEVGLAAFEPEFLMSYVFTSDREREYVSSFRTVAGVDDLSPSDELDGGGWWEIAELREKLDLLTPNLRHELSLLGILRGVG